jgi:hypothetical protein
MRYTQYKKHYFNFARSQIFFFFSSSVVLYHFNSKIHYRLPLLEYYYNSHLKIFSKNLPFKDNFFYLKRLIASNSTYYLYTLVLLKKELYFHKKVKLLVFFNTHLNKVFQTFNHLYQSFSKTILHLTVNYKVQHILKIIKLIKYFKSPKQFQPKLHDITPLQNFVDFNFLTVAQKL